MNVTRFAAAADVGQEVNPHHCTQQIQGAAIVTLGLTFYEWMNVDQGQVTNASLLEYQLPSLKDLPPELILQQSELDDALNFRGLPSVAADALSGRGVFETLKAISALVLKRLSQETPK